MLDRKHLGCLFGTSVLAFYLASAQAAPQQAAADATDQDLEEVLVSARKRSESLQEIPLSISAFTDEQLQQAGITNLEDIARQTVGLNVNTRLAGTVPGRTGTALRFRGISIEGTGASLPNQATASVFVDGIYVFGGAESISLNDLQRVEVIKGPQSAFFGRNTFAGAVNYITKDPDLQEHVGRLDLKGATKDQYDLNLSINGPLLDNKLGYGIALRHYTRGSMWTASDGGGLGEEETNSISGKLLLQAADALQLRARVYFQTDRDGPAAAAYLPGSTNWGYPVGFGAYPNIANANASCAGVTVSGVNNAGTPATFVPRNYVCGRVPDPDSAGAPAVSVNTVSAGRILAANPNFIQNTYFTSTAIPGVPTLDSLGLKSKLFRSSLSVDWSIGGGYDLSLTGSYNSIARNWVRDFDNTDVDNFYSADPLKGEDRSVEIRFSSPADKRFRWLVGVSGAKQKFLQSNVGGLAASTCVVHIAGTTPCLTGPAGFSILLPPDSGEEATVKNYFASASFDLVPDKFTIDIEGSQLEDERTQSGFAINYKKFVPRGILRWTPSPNTTLYGSYSIGALPGAVNARIITASTSAFTTPYIDPLTGQPSRASERDQLVAALGPNFGEFTPVQELEEMEIGWKQQLLDGRITLALAAYDYKWKNRLSQQFVAAFFDAPNIIGVRDGVPNAQQNTLQVNVRGGAETRGLEFESAWRVTDALSVGLNIAWNDNEVTQQFNPFVQQYLKDPTDTTPGCLANVVACRGTGNVAGTTGSRYPEIQGNANIAYTGTLASGNEWYVRGDWLYTGETEADAYEIAKISSYSVVNARVGMVIGGLELELFSNNLFDERKWAAGQQFADFTRQDGFLFNRHGVQLIPLDKRTFGLRLGYKF